tara:strand:+ start:1399 stop:1581 length:183 start_codon:yes stop_codon:yes gene_type:complete
MAFPTNPIYKLVKSVYTGDTVGVKKQTANSEMHIPLSQDNTDYQEYLEWVAEGNTAEAAD